MEIAKFNRSVDREDTARRKKVMLHRFIAELFVEGVCTNKFLTERVTDLIGQGKRNFAEADEPLECLCVLFTFAGAKLEETRHEWLNDIFLTLNLKEAAKSPIISKRIQFMLLDLIEMRSKGWVPHNKWWTPSVAINHETTASSGEHHNTTQDSGESCPLVTPDFKATGISKKNYGKRRANTSTIQAILNKVGPRNLDQMAAHCASILLKHQDQLETALDVILNHVLEDTMYVRVHASLLSRISDTVPLFGKKLVQAMLHLVEQRPGSVEIIRLFAELYNVGLIPLRDIISVLEKLVATPCIESACAFLLGAGRKLEIEVKDTEPEGSEGRLWMNSILFSLEQKGQMESARLKCLIMDTIDVRRNGWTPTRYLHWNPVLVDPSVKLHQDPESVIGVCKQSGVMEGLQFIKMAMPLRIDREQFVFNAVLWAINTCDVEIQKLTGNCVNAMKREKLISFNGLRQTIGRLMENVTKLRETTPRAWNDLGFIMGEIYGN